MRLLIALVALLALAAPARPAGRDVERVICDGVGDRPGRLYRIVVPDWAGTVELLENGCIYQILDGNLQPVEGKTYKSGAYIGTRQTDELKKFGRVLD